MTLHNFLFFVSRSNVYLLYIHSPPSVIYLQKFTIYSIPVSARFPKPFPPYVTQISNVSKYKYFFRFHFCLKTFSYTIRTMSLVFHISSPSVRTLQLLPLRVRADLEHQQISGGSTVIKTS